MDPWRIAVVVGLSGCLLVGLLVGVTVAKNNRPPTSTSTFTFLKRVPGPITMRTVTAPGKTGKITVTVPSTAYVPQPPSTVTLTRTKSFSTTTTVTQTVTVTTTAP